jgi:hypothetical protein
MSSPRSPVSLAVTPSFVVRFCCGDPAVEPPARIDDEDIQQGVEHALVVEEVGEDPLRFLVLGPDRAGNVLELVILDRPHGPAVIHAMKMRPKYRRLLPGSE